MYVCVLSIITVVHVLVSGVNFDNPHDLHVTYNGISHILCHVVCSGIILFVYKYIVCYIFYKCMPLKVVYVYGILLILKDKL